MIRPLLLAALLLAPQARAAPFDTYQMIEWQELTPTQTAGLAPLGFTATKLRATGGQIDPADLAARIASGLPWYLENIATDLLSPYHRYTSGKPVTWLFDQLKARRRADPADTTVFIRTPSLSDPAWLQTLATRLQSLAAAQQKYRPLFYNLADEAGIGDLAAAWDADIAPPSLTAFRIWLRTQYPDLDALNAEWATAFPGWDAVMPELTDAALRRTDDNFAAWADFKAFMDTAFAHAIRTGTDALHEADPSALSALEGAQLPGWGGYDYSLLAQATDVMEVYDYGNAQDLAHAFNPALILLRTSFGQGPREHHAAWRHLLHGGRGTIVWDEADDVVQPDGSPGPRGRDIAAFLAEIAPVAPALLAATPDPDPIAVLISQSSFRTRWLLDRRPGGGAWSDRDAGREYEDNAWRASRRQLLERLSQIAIQPHLLSTAMLEQGALRRDGIRVLILPHCIALSDAETAEIAAFANAGGTVLADTQPALFDNHSRRRPAPALLGTAHLPEALLLDGTPIAPAHLTALLDVLHQAGVTPRATLRGPDGQPAIGVEAQWLRTGARTLLTLQTLAPYSAPSTLDLVLPTPALVTDLRAPTTAQPTKDLHLDPIAPTLLEICRITPLSPAPPCPRGAK